MGDRVLNVLIGLSALSWAVLGLTASPPASRLTAARLTIAALNGCVGVLFLLRSAVVRHGSVGAILLSLPSLVIAGAALKLAPSPELWGAYANVVFVVGGALAWAAFVSLGRSFAILPAVRSVVRRGPYAMVRHPAYLGEMAMVAGCCLAHQPLVWWHFWPMAAALPAVIARILAEERVLGSAAEYGQYARGVRWRLMPGVW